MNMTRILTPILREGEPGDGGGGGGAGDGAGAGGEPSFIDSIPEEFRAHEHVKNLNSMEDMVKSHISAQDMISKSIRIPGDDADDTVRESFYQKLDQVEGVVRIPSEGDEDGAKQFWAKVGVPESPDKYEGIVAPEELPEGLGYSKEMEDWFKQTAHKNNIPEKAAAGLYKDYNEFKVAELNAMKEEYQSVEAELTKSWGQDYEKRAAIASNVAEKFGGPEFMRALETLKTPDGKTMGNHAIILKTFAAIGEAMGEAGLVEGNPAVGPTTEELQAQIDEIRNNNKHPYYDNQHPGHDAAVKKVNELTTKIISMKEGKKN